MNGKLRIGVIGVGSYSLGYHMPIIKRSPDAELTAICRRSPEKLAEAARQFQVAHTFTDYRQMLDEVKLDAVAVSGPNGLHYEHCKAALERGLHVLVDKHMVLHTAEAEELVALAKEKGLVLSVGYNRHFDPANLYARKLIQEGHLGELIYAQAIQLGYPSPDTWYFDPELGGGGPWIGRGTHMVDLIPWTTGLKPTEVTGSLAWQEGLKVDIGGTITMKLEGEVVAQVSSFWKQDHNRDEAYYYGTKGSIAVVRPFGLRAQQALRRPPYSLQVDHIGTWAIEHRDGAGNLVEPKELPPAYTTTENFIDAILGRDENRATGEDGVWTVKVIEAAYRSARTGRRVSLR